jgi:hypothetical protein
MQVQTGIGRFLVDNELLNPHSAHTLAWWMVKSAVPQSQATHTKLKIFTWP